MKDYSSLKVGGEGNMVIVRSMAELINAVSYAHTHNLIPHVVGEGTNTYFGDILSHYLFIKNEIKGISCEEQENDIFVTASAGEKFDDIVAFSVEKGWWGIENLSLIPGTAGAAPLQNIGAYGTELKDTLVSVLAYDITTSNTVEISNEACAFGYRDSLFKQEKDRYCIMSITLKLSCIPNPVLTYKPLDGLLEKKNCTLEDIRNLVVATRRSKLPDYKECPNVGSFFKNAIVTTAQAEGLRRMYPEIPLITHQEGYKIPTAWLIEHVACMKGVRVGDLGTWPNQPLVIVNYGSACAQDVMDFSGDIIQKIKDKVDIDIEREVNYIS